MTAGRSAATFPQATEDYFHDMDRGVTLTRQEIQGRNMWMVWTGGNDRFWDQMARTTAGSFDLLKVISSHPNLGFSRADRWHSLGVVNEPCFEKPSGPDRTRFGLWLDVRKQDCVPEPFEDAGRYPGVAIGARGQRRDDGTTLPVGSYYGYATGIVGLRLFPNPDFTAQAAKAWDPERYYNDPSYYNRKDLIRPYRVGVACAFCHVGPSPLRPPADPEAPAFTNLGSFAGAQSLWVDRLFRFNSAGSQSPHSFMQEVLRTYRPGTMDTSAIATDNINNPRAVNALYGFVSRLRVAASQWHEQLAGDELHNEQLDDSTQTPHLLADGADSVGVLGALNRAYLNIGVFSEEWLTHFNPVVGGKAPTPMRLTTADKGSVYWQSTETGTPQIARFLLKATLPDHLADAPGGNQYLGANPQQLAHGKEVFADTCARCHSSKGPLPPAELNLDANRCAGTLYLECFKRYWAWTQSDDYRKQMRAIVAAPDFLEGNYLSTDARIPVTLLRTNVCSALATNATAGEIWSSFSSHSYKQLAAVGAVTLYDPFTGEPFPYEMPEGGRGYTRVPSLIGLWSTAPFLLNNSIGPFDPDPSVGARVKAFEASIEQLLWPRKRERDSVLADKIPGMIDRTQERSQLRIPASGAPESLRSLRSDAHWWLPRWINAGGDIELGPLPAGMPIGLLANLQLLPRSDAAPAQAAAHRRDVNNALSRLRAGLSRSASASNADLLRTVKDLSGEMLQLSKCPDLVVNRGHYFGTAQFNDQAGLTQDEQSFGKELELNDDDKRALLAFLRTF